MGESHTGPYQSHMYIKTSNGGETYWPVSIHLYHYTFDNTLIILGPPDSVQYQSMKRLLVPEFYIIIASYITIGGSDENYTCIHFPNVWYKDVYMYCLYCQLFSPPTTTTDLIMCQLHSRLKTLAPISLHVLVMYYNYYNYSNRRVSNNVVTD